MTAQDLASAIAALGLTQADFAARLGRSPRAIRRWLSGKAPVPHWVVPIVNAMVDGLVVT